MASTIDVMFMEKLAEAPKCGFCGGPSDAVSGSSKTIAVCLPCAFEFLPSPMGDACLNGLSQNDFEAKAKKLWAIAETQFWSAIGNGLAEEPEGPTQPPHQEVQA